MKHYFDRILWVTHSNGRVSSRPMAAIGLLLTLLVMDMLLHICDCRIETAPDTEVAVEAHIDHLEEYVHDSPAVARRSYFFRRNDTVRRKIFVELCGGMVVLQTFCIQKECRLKQCRKNVQNDISLMIIQYVEEEDGKKKGRYTVNIISRN